MTIAGHPTIALVILDVRCDAGFSTPKDGAHPRDQLTDTLDAHDQIYPLIIFLETFFLGTKAVSFLHRDDGNRAQQAPPSKMSDGVGSMVKKYQGGDVRVRCGEGSPLRSHRRAAIPAHFERLLH